MAYDITYMSDRLPFRGRDLPSGEQRESPYPSYTPDPNAYKFYGLPV